MRTELVLEGDVPTNARLSVETLEELQGPSSWTCPFHPLRTPAPGPGPDLILIRFRPDSFVQKPDFRIESGGLNPFSFLKNLSPFPVLGTATPLAAHARSLWQLLGGKLWKPLLLGNLRK